MGALRANYTPRPYPVKTAGVPIAFSVEEEGFRYRWANIPAAGDAGTTEMFLPTDYGEDKELTIDSPAAEVCTINGQILTCRITAAGEVSVTLARP